MLLVSRKVPTGVWSQSCIEMFKEFISATYLQDNLLALTTLNLQTYESIDDSFQPKTPQSQFAILTIDVTLLFVITT